MASLLPRSYKGIVLAALLLVTVFPTLAQAHLCSGCPGDCPDAVKVIIRDHEEGEQQIIRTHQPWNLVSRMTEHKSWTVNDFFKNHWLPKLMAMSTNLTAVAMEQMRIVGLLFDAKHLLETNRMVQELQVQANRDYHPSESFCWFGTNIRSITQSEVRGRLVQSGLSAMQLSRQLGNQGVASALEEEDIESRWERFKATYCDPRDNNESGMGTGLRMVPGCGGGDAKRRNRDIDFTRLIDTPRTLPVNFEDGAGAIPPEEEDVMALASNLYGHRPPTRQAEGLASKSSGAQNFYFDLRSVMAKRAVAQESFSAIVGLKAEAETEGDTAQYLASIAKNAGFDSGEVLKHIGEKPSTYAQLEALSQTIFQSPDFYVTLYDKPVNIERKKAALNAVELMLDRYLYESELRQEMLLSVLLSASGQKEFEEARENMQGSRATAR